MPNAANLALKSQQGEGLQEGRCPLDLELTEQTDPTGRLVAFSQVGSFQKDAGPGQESIQYPHEGDDPNFGAALQDAGDSRSHHTVSCLAEQKQTGTYDPLATGTGYEGSPSAYIVGLPGAQQRVATDSSQIETSSSAAVQDGG